MTKSERRASVEKGLSSPQSRRSRRGTSKGGNEDIFLNLANDENDNNLRDPASANQAINTVMETSKPTKLDTQFASGRRSRGARLDAQASNMSVAIDPQPSSPGLSGYQPMSPVPTNHRERSPETTPVSSSNAKGRNTSRSGSGYPGIVNGQPSDQYLTGRRTASISGVTSRAIPSGSTNLRRSEQIYDTPSPIEPPYNEQSSRILEHPPPLRSPTDGAESVGSNTAVSTVWDELEELRLRIRRLEHSGNRARMGVSDADESGDRPHTATTMTTNSSISHPLKHPTPSPSHPPSAVTQPAFPLLQAALLKAGDSLSPEAFHRLEACVSDATAASDLAAKTESDQSLNGSTDTATVDYFPQKRLRRKVDNICRSLTELCVALCDEFPRQLPRSSSRPGSGDRTLHEGNVASDFSPLAYLDERRSQLDRTSSVPNRPSSRTAGSLVATRRPSYTSSVSRQSLLSRYDYRRPSIAEDDEEIVPQRSLSRAGTAVGPNDDEDRDPTIRAPSRAMTEVQSMRRTPSRDLHKFSRDYTSRHPLPDRPFTFSRQTFDETSQSSATLSTAQPSQATSRAQSRSEGRASARVEGQQPLLPSPTLAERLAQRRERQQQQQQQQQRQVSMSGQLGSIASAGTGHVSSTHKFSETQQRRPTSSDRSFERQSAETMSSDASASY